MDETLFGLFKSISIRIFEKDKKTSKISNKKNNNNNIIINIFF